jgi:uncharacterized protein (DUF2252 family)
MKIPKATEKYEAWLAKHTPLLAVDLKLKHQRMMEDAFPFLRATFYRWAQVWPEICSDLAKAPAVLAVGDLHVENFGTWRDVEGRLIWGVNDFDEAYPMPYTNDLVRLATSAHLAIAGNHLVLNTEDACHAILEGYQQGLAEGGNPYVLEQNHGWLRKMATGALRDPEQFWGKMDALPTIRGEIPKAARKALEGLLPERGLSYRVAHRVAGLGSLGRQRFVAIAEWRGGKVVREAKALVSSAWVWANSAHGSKKISYEEILRRAVRVIDPFVHLRGTWIVRRLAPHCSRIELASLPRGQDEKRLLHSMGFETANVHLGSKDTIRAVVRDLKKRPAGWLHKAGKEMVKATIEDWEEWKKAAAKP